MLRQFVVGVGVAVVIGGGVSVSGQAPESKPSKSQPSAAYRGLFGPEAVPAGGQNLNAMIELFGEYGNGIDLGANLPAGSLEQQNAYFSGVRTDVTYNRRGEHGSFGLRTEGSLRYYPALRTYTGLQHRTDIGLSAVLGAKRRTSVTTAASVEYAPYYAISFFPNASTLSGSSSWTINRDDALLSHGTYTYSGSFGIEHTVSPRSSFGIHNNFRFADVSGAPGVRDLQAGMSYSRKMSPYFAVRAGYAYRQGQYGRQSQIVAHDIDLGVDYRRPITRSRKTTISFGSGSTLVQVGREKQYRIGGAASLRSELPRGWTTQLEYSRGVQLIEGFAHPFFADTVTESLGGYLGRRVQLSTSVGYSFGEVGLVGDRYRALQAQAGLRFAATRHTALDVQYLFYRHGFDGDVALMDALPRALDRSSARINLTLWLPLFR